MSKRKEKLIKQEKEADLRENYLYKYPSYRLESNPSAYLWFALIFFYAVIIWSAFFDLPKGNLGSIVALLIIFIPVAFMFYGLIKVAIQVVKRKYGIHIEKKSVAFMKGKKVLYTVPYDYYYDCFKKGIYGYGKSSFWVGEEKNRVDFWYEVGYSKRQKNNIHAYESFEKFIEADAKESIKIPAMTVGLEKYFDKDFYYDRKKFHSFVFVIATILFYLYLADTGVINILLTLIIAILQGIAVQVSYKYSYLSDVNKKTMLQKVGDENVAILDKTYTNQQYWAFVVTLVVALVGDILMIFVNNSSYYL